MENENLDLFQQRLRGFNHYLYGETKCIQDEERELSRIYQLEKSEEVKKEMILNLYRILLIECQACHRAVHAIVAVRIDNHLTGIIRREPCLISKS